MSRKSRGVFRRSFQQTNQNRHGLRGSLARALNPDPFFDKPPCRTAADMTPEEIAALESKYGAKLKR